MIRFSVLLLFVLTSGITAKPLKPWERLANEAAQKGWVSIDDKGMASWGEEVEPPQDMDETSFDIDPSMKVWKKVQIEQSKKSQMAEDDATADLLKAYVESKPDAPPAVVMHAQHDKNDIELEKEVYKYLAPLVSGYDGGPVGSAAHFKPEQDEDEDDQADVDFGMQVVPLEPKMDVNLQGRRHMEPEQDMDDIYHKDVPEMIPYNIEAQPAAAAAYWPVQRMHMEPEEDLDDIYHH